LVRVVVRDSQGHAVGNLHKEDFQVFDKGKLQVLSQFSIEQPGARAASEQKSSESESSPDVSTGAKPTSVPERFVGYLFDDVHLKFGDLAQVRTAAERNLALMQPTDRAAIFSTSGQSALDFSDDREQLRQTLVGLQPRPVARSGVQECPDIPYYVADLIVNKHDPRALAVATQDTLVCQFQSDPKFLTIAQSTAEASASQRLVEGDAESRLALGVLKDVVRRMSIIPGQRNIVLVSPGFLTPEMEYDFMEIVNRALRSDIVINAIDARGLYTVVPGGDISQHPNGSMLMQGYEAQYQMQSATAEAFVLGDLASSTGGFFFHNSNDLVEGFRRVVATPEYSYVLGFSPQNLKADGSFHALKVKLLNSEKVTVDARRGYYAPKQMADASEEAKREIEDELFSQEELHGLPVDLHTQFFKAGDTGAKLSVLAHVDVKRLSFHKGEGRNRNDLTIVSGLFDRNGNYITANEKVLEMRLRDATLENKLNSGITVKTSFDVKPGSYLVRLVVRDAEKQLMSAESGAVQIP
jgi:VWFA-related protein